MTTRALIICGIVPAMLIGCGKADDSYEKSFKASFQKTFVKSCTASAMRSGLQENDAKSKCDCAAAYLIGKYSSAELMKLTATELPENKKIMSEAVNSCK